MPTIEAPLPTPRYVLTESIQERPRCSAAAYFDWNEQPQETSILNKLGPKGWERIQRFKNLHGIGGANSSRPLSPKGLSALYRFVASMNFPQNAKPPSVFLTDLGGIELCWETAEGAPIQVEFTGVGVEVYRGNTDEESFVKFADITSLANSLSA